MARDPPVAEWPNAFGTPVSSAPPLGFGKGRRAGLGHERSGVDLPSEGRLVYEVAPGACLLRKVMVR